MTKMLRLQKWRRLATGGHAVGELQRRFVELAWNPLASGTIARALERQNELSARPVTGDVPCVVSLTTYGERFQRVHLAIESIARGTVHPARIILWLDDERLMENPTPEISRLISRGLEVRLAQNFGPHTKYFPAVMAGEVGESEALVTADDDILYPRRWLQLLRDAARTDPEAIVAHRAHRVTVAGHDIMPYAEWEGCWTTDTSLSHFATGVSGVLYPQRMIDELRNRGDAFTEASPKNDDIWLHATAVEAGIGTRQVSPFPWLFPMSPGTQESALAHNNVTLGSNDLQVARTYQPGAVERLRGATVVDGEQALIGGSHD